MTVANDALASRRAVEARLQGGRADVAGIAVQAFLLLSLIVTLGVLVVLLTDIVLRAVPAFAERGADVITAPLSARPARAGMIQGVIGSLILTAFVIVRYRVSDQMRQADLTARREAELARQRSDKSLEDKYIVTLERVLAADPTNTTLQVQVVSELARQGKLDKAKSIIDESVKQSPGDPDLIKLQWRVYRARNDWKGAIAVGEEMVKHDTAAADTLFFQQLVAAYLSDSQPVKAQEAASRGAKVVESSSSP